MNILANSVIDTPERCIPCPLLMKHHTNANYCQTGDYQSTRQTSGHGLASCLLDALASGEMLSGGKQEGTT